MKKARYRRPQNANRPAPPVRTSVAAALVDTPPADAKLGDRAKGGRLASLIIVRISSMKPTPTMGARGRLHLSAFAVSRQVGRLRRVCSSRMMLMKKYGEAISQERIVGNRGLKESFLHITR